MDHDEIDELMLRVLTGRASPEEQAKVTHWRSQSPVNDEAYHATSQALSLAASAQLHRSGARPPSVEALLARRDRTGVGAPAAAGSGAAPPSLLRRARAATILPWAAAVLLSVGVYLQSRGGPNAGAAAVREVVTGVEETATVVLEEGSVVRLAPGSRLRVHNTTEERSVSLNGRAYFAVAKNPDAPFRILTPSGEVEVLGTRFDLDADDADLRVTVVEGTVVLTKEEAEARLEAGQVGRILRGTLLPPESVPDPLAAIDWLGDFLAFQETPFDRVIPEIERIYDVDVQLENPALADHTVTIYFADWSLPEVVEAVCLILQAQCSIEGELVRIGRSAAPGVAR